MLFVFKGAIAVTEETSQRGECGETQCRRTSLAIRKDCVVESFERIVHDWPSQLHVHLLLLMKRKTQHAHWSVSMNTVWSACSHTHTTHPHKRPPTHTHTQSFVCVLGQWQYRHRTCVTKLGASLLNDWKAWSYVNLCAFAAE